MKKENIFKTRLLTKLYEDEQQMNPQQPPQSPQPQQQMGQPQPMLVDLRQTFPDLPNTDDPCELMDFFSLKCAEVYPDGKPESLDQNQPQDAESEFLPQGY